MSLSFPPAPTDGQQYQSWVWSAARASWQPNFAAGFVTSFNGRAGAVTMQPGDNTSGNRVLLSKQTISTAVAAVDFFSATLFDPTKYDEVELALWDVGFANDQTTPYLQVSVDGATVALTANYFNGYLFAASNNTNGFSGNANVSSMAMGPYATNSAMTLFGQVRARLSTVAYSAMTWQLCSNNAAAQFAAYGGGFYNAAAAIKGLRFTSDKGAGAINRGTLALYGILK